MQEPPAFPIPIHLAESMERRPGFLQMAGPPPPAQTSAHPDKVLIRQRPGTPERRETHASPLDGFRVGSVGPKRFWGVFRRANVGFPMSNAIPHVSPHRLSAYRNELESMSEILTLNSRGREIGARAWPPDPVFTPPTRRTERPGDAPWCSRGTRAHRPVRGRSRPRKVNRGTEWRSRPSGQVSTLRFTAEELGK